MRSEKDRIEKDNKVDSGRAFRQTFKQALSH